MRKRWAAVAVFALAGAIIGWREWQRPSRAPAAPTASASAARVVLYVDLGEVVEAEGCGAIIRAVRQAQKRGVVTEEIDARTAEPPSRYRLLVAPAVLIVDGAGHEVRRLRGRVRQDRPRDRGGSRKPPAFKMSPEWMSAALSSGSVSALPLAFVGGVLVGLNPCCLAFYPAVAGTCCATGALERTRVVASSAVAFVGTALATTAMGILAALAGHAVLGVGRWPRYAIAAVPLAMGTHLLGWLRLPLPSAARWELRGFAAAFAAGLLLALVIGSCGTPVLAAILAYAAYKGNLVFGAALLFLYGLGNGLPLLVVGTAAGAAARLAARPQWQAWTERLAGVALVGLGFYLILSVA